MSGALQVRPCTIADLAVVRALLIETWHATYDGWLGADTVREITATWHSERQLAEQIDEPGSLFLVALEDGHIIGTAFAHESDDRQVELGRLYVQPRHQRVGVGTALLAGVQNGFPAAVLLHLDVEPRNVAAIRFYQRHGFTIVDTRGRDGAPGLAHVRMELQRKRSPA